MTRTNRGIALAMVALAVMSGCRRSPETVVPADTTPPVPPPTCDSACMRARADSAARAQALRDSLARAADAARAREAAVTAARNTLLATIYFDYDAAEIRGDARAALDAKLPILRLNSGVQIRISGHADERGSDQYNDALGQRRAAAARRYLSDNGIDAARISIVSFGEQRPATMGADENAWSRNRRAEFEITAGGENIVPPQ